jgi:Tol biopolymer transport system component
MKPNTHLKKPWYVERSNKYNPKHPLNYNGVGGNLERRVDITTTNNDYSVNNNTSGFWGYVNRITQNILSSMPLPIKAGVTGLTIAVLATTIGGCSSQTEPVARHERSAQTEVQTKDGQTIVITDESTYKVIFPYRAPSSSLEESVLKETDEATYMKFVRAEEGLKWIVEFTKLYNNSVSPSQWKNFLNKNKEISDLLPYIPLEDTKKYQESQLNYQGTRRVDSSGKPIIPEPVYFQQTATGELILINKPDMDKQMFDELKRIPLSQKETISSGSMVSFDIKKSGRPREIYLVDITAKEVIQLTNDRFYNKQPAISPDGTKVVFISDRGKYSDIWIMDIATREVARLTNTLAGEISPSWSEDGKKIVFRRIENIYSMDIYKGSSISKLIETQAIGFSQAFSTDGTQIIYFDYLPKTESRIGGIYLMIMDSDGNNPRQFKGPELFKEPDWRRNFIEVDWSVNNEIVAIMSETSKTENKKYNGVVVMDSNGSNIQKITWGDISELDGPVVGFNHPSWSQDGKFIFYKQNTDKFFVIDLESGSPINLETFKWTSIDIPLKEVNLEELLK